MRNSHFRPKQRLRVAAMLLVLALLGTACSGDGDAETMTTSTSLVPPATSAAPTTPGPTTTAPEATTAAVLSACEQYFADLDVLAQEFVQLVDEGNRILLLTIGQETTYDQGSESLDRVATRLREISGEVADLGTPPESLALRVDFMVQAVDQFAVGYAEAAEAAAIPDAIALNRSLTTVSFGTGLLESAASAPASCPAGASG